MYIKCMTAVLYKDRKHNLCNEFIEVESTNESFVDINWSCEIIICKCSFNVLKRPVFYKG